MGELINKPPLGAVPRFIHDEVRLQELDGAIERYLDAGYVVPGEWYEEFFEIYLRLKKGRNE